MIDAAPPPEAFDAPRAVAEAMAHLRARRLDQAEAAARAIAARQPACADALLLLGLIELGRGRARSAANRLRRAIAADPGLAEAHGNLGIALGALGQTDAAIAAWRQAIALKPDDPEILAHLGAALGQRGKLDEAAAILRRLCALTPRAPEAFANLGEVLRRQGRLDEAVAAFGQAIARGPAIAMAHLNLGIALRAQGKLDAAIAAYRHAIALNPDLAEAYSNLAIALGRTGAITEAIAACRRAIVLKPDLAEAHSNLAAALGRSGAIAEAMDACRRAIALKPDLVAAHVTLASALTRRGRLAEARASYRRALALEPGSAITHSNLLFSLNYDGEMTPEELLTEHLAWAAAHAPPLAALDLDFPNDTAPERRLTIGYVSADFHQHSAMFFLEALLAARDRGDAEVICYAAGSTVDATTVRLKALADRWVPIVGLGAKAAASRIRADHVDILFDLAGHSGESRLDVFALKPAPVQIAWLGYPNTTGLAAIDYRMTDAIADPEGAADRFCSERLVRLKRGFLCYRPPEDAPEVGALPARAAGYVTFGSFNNVAKMTPAVVALWAKVLAAVPRSRLLLKSLELGDAAVAAEMRGRLGDAGIAPERLEIAPWERTLAHHLALYDRVDIALDPFPYNGTTTTCEALWMGVPVVTLRGDRHAGRVGASLLTQVGLEELVAADPAGYVAAAAGLAQALDRLAARRAGLRERMRTSPLCDAAEFARAMAAVCRAAWRGWCTAENRAI